MSQLNGSLSEVMRQNTYSLWGPSLITEPCAPFSPYCSLLTEEGSAQTNGKYMACSQLTLLSSSTPLFEHHWGLSIWTCYYGMCEVSFNFQGH